jgi:hypothetical protein
MEQDYQYVAEVIDVQGGGRMPGSDSREVKMRVAVVGGVYRERCRLPYSSDETWGSGGRGLLP